ncbi:MAG: hypothetical protein EON48_05965 [Acetobacteraceae bacterium]|nr:MAG: hypothetical protein EON48_05965 [Acetobacteraceae bacterium]
MLWRQKILRVTAAFGVAAAAAHTAERLKAPADEQPFLITAAQITPEPKPATAPESPVPQSASLSTPTKAGIGELIGITPVAAATPAGGDTCKPTLQLTAMPGAMIHLALDAPCNRGERIVVRHAGLSFAAKTQADGVAVLNVPALKSDAMVAIYLQDARLVLGKIKVPDASAYSRFAVVWELPAELELRVTDGDKVLVGSAAPGQDDGQKVIALGSPSVQAPVLARVYSVAGPGLGRADITAELRITPASCGRTLRVETVYSAGGIATAAERDVSVPLCGTSGDILVLKNLAPALKLAAPK